MGVAKKAEEGKKSSESIDQRKDNFPNLKFKVLELVGFDEEKAEEIIASFKEELKAMIWGSIQDRYLNLDLNQIIRPCDEGILVLTDHEKENGKINTLLRVALTKGGEMQIALIEGDTTAELSSKDGKLYVQANMKLRPTEVIEKVQLPAYTMHDYTKNFVSKDLERTISVKVSSSVSINVPYQLGADISRQKYTVGGKKIDDKDLEGLCKEVLVLTKGDVKVAENILRMCTQATLGDPSIEVRGACSDNKSEVYPNKNYHSYFDISANEGHLKLSVKQFFYVGDVSPEDDYSEKDIAGKTNILAYLIIDFTTGTKLIFIPVFP